MGNQRNNRNGQKDRKGNHLGSYFLVSVSHRLLVPTESRMTGVGCRKNMTHRATENGAEAKKPQSWTNDRWQSLPRVSGKQNFPVWLHLQQGQTENFSMTRSSAASVWVLSPCQGCYEEAGQCFCFPMLGWLFLSKHAENHILEEDQANSELVQSYLFFIFILYYLRDLIFGETHEARNVGKKLLSD